jgi:hypothetical protein
VHLCLQRFRAVLLSVPAILVVACGSSDESNKTVDGGASVDVVSAPGGEGGRSSPGTGGGLGAGGTAGGASDAAADSFSADSVSTVTDVSTDGQASRCRRYLTQGAASGPGGSGTISASFDASTLTYSSTFSFGPTQITQSRIYPSLDAFISEAQVVARIFWREESTRGAVQQTTTTQFDSAGRLVAKTLVDLTGTDATTTYSQWDGLGRPTRGSMTANPAETDCANMPVSIVYDDAARTRTETIDAAHGTGSGCLKQEYINAEKYDQDGDQVEVLHPGEAAPTVISVTNKQSVCLD